MDQPAPSLKSLAPNEYSDIAIERAGPGEAAFSLVQFGASRICRLRIGEPKRQIDEKAIDTSAEQRQRNAPA